MHIYTEFEWFTIIYELALRHLVTKDICTICLIRIALKKLHDI